MRIAVISDIHAALAPFRTALHAARREGCDQIILLGDMFTYGVDPVGCAELAVDAVDKDGAIFIGGNHDQIYVELGAGRSSYFDELPDWIRESVDWTWGELGKAWPSQLAWTDEWVCDGILFAHANPFGFGDWTYLSDEVKLARAASVLAAKDYRAGVFGHLHREISYVSHEGTTVHVVGSTGQPRRREEPVPQWAMVELTPQTVSVTSRGIPFDSEAHRSAIRAAAGISERTKNLLCRYFP